MSTEIAQNIQKKVDAYRLSLIAGICLFYFFVCVIAGLISMAVSMGVLADWLAVFKNRWTAGALGIVALMVFSKGYFPLGLWHRLMSFLDNETDLYESALWRAARCIPGYYR